MNENTARSRPDRNEVALVGRLSGDVEIRTVPSGDEVASWRLVVRRPAGQSHPGATVDTIDCESFTKGVLRRSQTWTAGLRMEVEGTLRRRFWQTPAGARSRYVVDVSAARKVG